MPRNAPILQQPVVDQAVERQHRHEEQRVLKVSVVPEAGPVDVLRYDDEEHEPAAPH